MISTLIAAAVLLQAILVTSLATFDESLTLHPLPDGKLTVLFEFTTHFTGDDNEHGPAQSHHALTPPALLIPLQQANVSELLISFVSGQWDQIRTGQAGPFQHSAAGGGGEVRGWLRDDGDGKTADENWSAVTNALSGLFCAGLQPIHTGDVVKTFGDVYPPHSDSGYSQSASSFGPVLIMLLTNLDVTHFHLPRPEQHLCTENLTPFLSLLPSKGLSGLSSLLAQPGVVLSWGFQTEGIEVIMPDSSTSRLGQWRGWWEGVVDLVPHSGVGGSRDFDLETLFSKRIPRPFPEASSSLLRVISPHDEGFRAEPQPDRRSEGSLDGEQRELMEWDLSKAGSVGKNVRFWWEGEGDFKYRRHTTPPQISIARRMTAPRGAEGTLVTSITNSGDTEQQAMYSEVWPWWVKGWMSEMTVRLEGPDALRDDLLTHLDYHPSHPPHPSTTSLHLTLSLPPRSTLLLSIPFTKLTIKYTEHRPDAERGVELPSAVLTLLDPSNEDDAPGIDGAVRRHIYTKRLLLDVPTPDFSMPYNVIIMSSTVMAFFFGWMQGGLTRRWGFVEVAGRKKTLRKER